MKREAQKMAWEITPWKPFEFDRIRREMDRLWDSFLEGPYKTYPNDFPKFPPQCNGLVNHSKIRRQSPTQSLI